MLSRLGAEVVSVDRADLAPAVAACPRIEHRRGDAFGLAPETAGPLDWIVSDVVAYPERVLALARRWAEARPGAAMIFTVKFQHAPDPAALDAFLAMPGSGLAHLSHNKRELTWFRLPDGPPPEAARAPVAS